MAAALPMPEEAKFRDTFSLLAWWIVGITAALSIAGEKMPWLAYHIAWPLILFAAWGLGWLIESTPWRKLAERNALLVLGVGTVFITSLGADNLRLQIAAVELCHQCMREVVGFDISVKNSPVHVFDYNPSYPRRQFVVAFHIS